MGLVCPSKSTIWVDDKCFELRGPVIDNVSDHWSLPHSLKAFDDSKLDKMIEYGIDLVELYLSSLDCMKKFPDGDGDVDGQTVTFDGVMPTCFFNLPVHAGEFNPGSGEFEGELP